MRMIKATVLLALAAVISGGCRPASQVPQVPAAPVEPEPIDTQQQQMLQQILEYMQQSGSTLDALVEDVQRREVLARAPSGIERLGSDVRVAKALMGAARRGVTGKSAESTDAALQRLEPVLVGLRNQVPAAAITQHLERALMAISSYSQEEAINTASACLLAAVETAMGAPARLVPDVMKDIERAKAAVDHSDLTKAANQILAVLAQLAEHDSIALVDKARGEAGAIEQAIAREAWLVAGAGVDQLESLLTALQQQVEGESTAVAAEQVPETEEEAAVEEPAVETEETAPAAETEAVTGEELPVPGE